MGSAAAEGEGAARAVAGVDVRGDGRSCLSGAGCVRKELDPSGHGTPFDPVRETLEDDGTATLSLVS